MNNVERVSVERWGSMLSSSSISVSVYGDSTVKVRGIEERNAVRKSFFSMGF